jgi:hypothetical protein
MRRPALRACAAVAILAVLAWAGAAGAQCILANPSFEIAGSNGVVFRGWNQFGTVALSANATHGHLAARASGPNTGDWAVSGFWQSHDASPGETFRASIKGWHAAVNPLTGGCRAILNVEWRDSGGNLISYESHTVADASTPVDAVQDVSITTQPAPTGTASTHFLIGALQAPGTPVPDVYFDEADFQSLTPPTLDDIQWNDFPGGNSVEFSGRTWRVKGPGTYGPGPSPFCDDSDCVWVDPSGRLHLTVQRIGGSWYSTEVTLVDALSYGDYVFTTYGDLDLLDPNIVLGLFLWQYAPCYSTAYLWWNPYNEIDVELSRWGGSAPDSAQFVAQPYDRPGNLDRFATTFDPGELTSFAFRWLPDRVEFRSWRGGPNDESPANMIHAWTYTGPHIPRNEQPRVHLNLWQFNGVHPATGQEVVLDAFTFVPEGSAVGVPPETGTPAGPASYLRAARPNPFGATTTIAFTLADDAPATIVVYDVAGRAVRTLVDGIMPAGEHEVVWDGRDAAGNRVASGVYLYRLRAGSTVETRRVVLVD